MVQMYPIKEYDDAYSLACSNCNTAYDLANGDLFEIAIAYRIFKLSIAKIESDYNKLLDDTINERNNRGIHESIIG